MKLVPLTVFGGGNVWVNFNNVTHLLENQNGSTAIYFSTGMNPRIVVVEETPIEIRDLLAK